MIKLQINQHKEILVKIQNFLFRRIIYLYDNI